MSEPPQAPPSSEPSESAAAERSKRRVSRTLLTYVIIAIVIALIVSAILFQRWVLFWLSVIILIPYAILLMAPVWLARSSKVAEQERKAAEDSQEHR